MPRGYPLPASGNLLLASAKVFRLFKDFVRDLKKLLLNSFCKFYQKKKVSSLDVYFSLGISLATHSLDTRKLTAPLYSYGTVVVDIIGQTVLYGPWLCSINP